ncbi:hypothetical protein SAMN05216298_3893 [Glycomyces sambucus]|uniref:Uncharacterized protein n=1 Tax=Glycomyces sambucus TaxID=380244 RepID=A0A1G9K8P2_9ACTN|nr:hypothetical protein [Glycomyces sambucus]SDL45643.1 hypothetical protein SAMN05216298_3893 [Glycomyces sambucus]
MGDKQNDDQTTGYRFHGSVQTGAIGTGASATVGAIGEQSRGTVFVNRAHADEVLVEQMLELVEELRERLEELRDNVGERYEVISDNLDDLEESLEEAKPPGRVRSKLKAIERLVSPFAALVDLVTKLLELIERRQG